MTMRSPLNFRKPILFPVLLKSFPVEAYPTIDHKKIGKCIQLSSNVLLVEFLGSIFMKTAEDIKMKIGRYIFLNASFSFQAKKKKIISKTKKPIFLAINSS
jgi:hypothetical protein